MRASVSTVVPLADRHVRVWPHRLAGAAIVLVGAGFLVGGAFFWAVLSHWFHEVFRSSGVLLPPSTRGVIGVAEWILAGRGNVLAGCIVAAAGLACLGALAKTRRAVRVALWVAVICGLAWYASLFILFMVFLAPWFRPDITCSH